jgi:hypothetical protein
MSTKELNRRAFLKGTMSTGIGALGLGGGISSILNPAAVWAAGQPADGFTPKSYHFVFYYFPGGWDTMLSLDPRDPEFFNESNMGETGIQPGYQLLETTPKHGIYVDSDIGPLGGFVGDLRLPKYTQRICLVRGINMETLSHGGGKLRFMTGRIPEGIVPARDSTDVVMASLLGSKNLVPNITLGSTSINIRNPSYATALSAFSTADVVSAMTRSNLLDASLEGQIKALMEQQGACAHSEVSDYLSRAHGSRSTVQEMLTSGIADFFDFTAQSDVAAALRSHYGFSTNQLQSVEAMTALAEQALVQDVSRCISIRAPGVDHNYFDGHATLEQGAPQMRAFNAIARLMDNLEKKAYPDGSGDSWLDRTTIMCFSEFSRTPIINNTLGRDHWLTNSCLLAGGGIKGNQVIGASSDIGMNPRPLNLNTGLVDPKSKTVTPDNILRALYTMLGYDEDVADLRVEPLLAMLK